MDTKIVPLTQVKAGPAGGLDEGQFVGYASVFDNVDSYGEIVDKGAFTNTLAAWAEKGDPIPVLWGHDMADPYSNIGHVLAAEEDDHGLKVTAQLDLDNPKAAQVYRLLKGKRVNQMSFAFDVLKSADEDDARHLQELALYEVSVVPLGANQATEILDIKAGRAISAANEQKLQAAVDQIDTAVKTAQGAIDTIQKLLGGTDPAGSQDEGKASGAPVAKAEEPPAGAKAEEPPASPSARAQVQTTKLKLAVRRGQKGGTSWTSKRN